MSNLLVLLNIISMISSSSTVDFTTILNHSTSSDVSFANANNIGEWNDYGDYLITQNAKMSNKDDKENENGNDGFVSDSILDILYLTFNSPSTSFSILQKKISGILKLEEIIIT